MARKASGGGGGAQLASGYISLSVKYASAMSQISKDFDFVKSSSESAGKAISANLAKGVERANAEVKTLASAYAQAKAAADATATSVAKLSRQNEIGAKAAQESGQQTLMMADANELQAAAEEVANQAKQKAVGLYGQYQTALEASKRKQDLFNASLGNSTKSVAAASQGAQRTGNAFQTHIAAAGTKSAQMFHQKFAVEMARSGRNALQTGKNFASSLLMGMTPMTLTAAGAGLAIGAAVMSGFTRNSDMQEAKVKMEAMGYDVATVNEVMANSTTAVTDTQYSLADAMSASAQALAANVKPGKEMTDYLTMISNAAALGGKGYAETAETFNRIHKYGVLNLEDLNALSANNIPVMKALQDYYQKDAIGVRKMVENHEITTAQFEKLTGDMLEGVAKDTGRKTVKGAFANMWVQVGKTFASVLEPIMGDLPTMLNKVGDAIGRFSVYIKPGMTAAIQWMKDKWAEWWPKVKEVLDVVKQHWDKMWPELQKKFEPFKQAMVRLWNATKPIWKAIGQVIAGVVLWIVDHLPAITQFVTNVINWFATLLEWTTEEFVPFMKRNWDEFYEHLKGAIDWAKKFYEGVKDKFQATKEFLGRFFDWFAEKYNGFVTLYDAVQNVPGLGWVVPGESGDLPRINRTGAATPYPGDEELLSHVIPGDYDQNGIADLTKGVGDCTSGIEDLVNIIDGVSTEGRSLATGNAAVWLEEHGFVKGKGQSGDFRVGFWDGPGNAGHMQAVLPGDTPFNYGGDESAANRGIGGSGLDDPNFTDFYYRPMTTTTTTTTEVGLYDPKNTNPGLTQFGSGGWVFGAKGYADGDLVGGIDPSIWTIGGFHNGGVREMPIAGPQPPGGSSAGAPRRFEGDGFFDLLPVFASGGGVPGFGSGDIVPGWLTPGEFVVKKSQAAKHLALLRFINAEGYEDGDLVGGDNVQRPGYKPMTREQLGIRTGPLDVNMIGIGGASAKAEFERLRPPPPLPPIKIGEQHGVKVADSTKPYGPNVTMPVSPLIKLPTPPKNFPITAGGGGSGGSGSSPYPSVAFPTTPKKDREPFAVNAYGTGGPSTLGTPRYGTLATIQPKPKPRKEFIPATGGISATGPGMNLATALDLPEPRGGWVAATPVKTPTAFTPWFDQPKPKSGEVTGEPLFPGVKLFGPTGKGGSFKGGASSSGSIAGKQVAGNRIGRQGGGVEAYLRGGGSWGAKPGTKPGGSSGGGGGGGITIPRPQDYDSSHSLRDRAPAATVTAPPSGGGGGGGGGTPLVDQNSKPVGTPSNPLIVDTPHAGSGAQPGPGSAGSPGGMGNDKLRKLFEGGAGIGQSMFGGMFEGTTFSNPMEWGTTKSAGALLSFFGSMMSGDASGGAGSLASMLFPDAAKDDVDPKAGRAERNARQSIEGKEIAIGKERRKYEELLRNQTATDEEKAEAKRSLELSEQDLRDANEDFAIDYPATPAASAGGGGPLGFLQNLLTPLMPVQPVPGSSSGEGPQPGVPGQPHTGAQPAAPGPGGTTNIDLSNNQTISGSPQEAADLDKRRQGTALRSPLIAVQPIRP